MQRSANTHTHQRKAISKEIASIVTASCQPSRHSQWCIHSNLLHCKCSWLWKTLCIALSNKFISQSIDNLQALCNRRDSVTATERRNNAWFDATTIEQKTSKLIDKMVAMSVCNCHAIFWLFFWNIYRPRVSEYQLNSCDWSVPWLYFLFWLYSYELEHQI